jgi:cell division protein FtsB
MVATVLVFFMAVMVVGLVPFRQIISQRTAVSAAEDRLDNLTQANALLAEEIEALNTSVEVERRAREDFGLVRPGETAYVVVPIPPEEPAPVVKERSHGWLGDLVDFFTGRDAE